MHAESPRAEIVTTPDRANEPAQDRTQEWVTPDFDEQSACAEICAYVFHT